MLRSQEVSTRMGSLPSLHEASVKYHVLSVALIGAALLLQISGVASGRGGLGATLFTAGVACEFWFWIHWGASKKTRRPGNGEPIPKYVDDQ